ncbi:MAG: cytochrome c [Methylomonas sp.]|jgi:cytochrome c553
MMTVLRTCLIAALAVAVLNLPGCSVFATQSPAARTESTAYYTCGGCHGPKNVKVEFMMPKIIGQKQGYLAQKLRDFRDGNRSHPFMNGVSEPLSDQEIEDLAAYYANYGLAQR